MGDAPVVSHGRGGKGNIAEDNTKYVDGEIVRTGVEGQSATDGAYSTGRGGAANISGDPGQVGKRTDKEVVPEQAMRPSQEQYHTGRGGEGNAHKVEAAERTGLAAFVGKVKDRFFNKS